MFLPLPVCVKSREVLVSCTINTESVLNLRTTKTDWVSRCLLQLCHVRLVMSVVLFSVRRSSARGDDWHSSGMLRQQYDTSAVVSARAHAFYSVPYSYEYFLQVDALRTVSTRQNKDRQLHPCSVECTCTLMLFSETTHCDKQFFLQADS